MKNFKKFLGVALIAALMTMSFVACHDPDEEDPDVPPAPAGSFNVTFNAGEGKFSDDNSTKTVVVTDGATVAKQIATRDYQPGTVGLWSAYYVLTWQSGGSDYDFSKPVKSNLTLTAKWTAPANVISEATSPAGSTSVVEKAITYVNNKNDAYWLILDANDECPPVSLTGSAAQLTISSNSDNTETGKRTIQLKGTTGRLFTIGGTGSTPKTVLTLGKNIELKGVATNNTALVLVQNTAVFSMGPFSSLTGNTSNGNGYVGWTNNHGYGVAGVHVDGASLVVNGAKIYGNTNSLDSVKGTGNQTGSALTSAGGIYGESKATIYLVGNCDISDNTNAKGTADIYSTFSATIISLNGTAKVGEIGLGQGTPNAKITLENGFTGPTGQITINLGGAASNWPSGTDVLQGANSTNKAKFKLGKYLTTDLPSITSSLTDAGKIQ